jgi:hypothetical protein
MPAKENCASAWANHTAGRSAQNGVSRKVTLVISAGGELFAVFMLRRGSPMWYVDARDTHVTIKNVHCCYNHGQAGKLLQRLAWAGSGDDVVSCSLPANSFLAGYWRRRLATRLLLRAELWLPSVMLAVPSGAALRLSV